MMVLMIIKVMTKVVVLMMIIETWWWLLIVVVITMIIIIRIILKRNYCNNSNNNIPSPNFPSGTDLALLLFCVTVEDKKTLMKASKCCPRSFISLRGTSLMKRPMETSGKYVLVNSSFVFRKRKSSWEPFSAGFCKSFCRNSSNVWNGGGTFFEYTLNFHFWEGNYFSYVYH